MKSILAILALVVVAGCGADGAPIRPSANIGIGVGTNGVSAGAKLGASKGPVSIGVSL
ncbi:hypothetical protein NBRC116601_28270 [Cognatishimia sp. WU-CL00825]|uniref:hypothetical protein n=1 Tax=Cognatishimia sp. WU-CL00825 TaxID=3127658 RepID=UPI00310889DB